MKQKNVIHIPAVSVLLAFIFLLTGCGEQQEPQAPPPPKVTVSKPLVREVTEWDEYVGRLEATDSVEVRARVSGYLESIHFGEGEIVDKGDLLFIIDPRPFEAALNRAEGELELARARLQLAKSNLARAKKLLDSNAISTEEFDTRSSELEQAEAAVHSATAAVEEATLNLEFTEVKAPISGRVSSEFVTEGNLINGGTGGTLLTTIVSPDPIYCYFEIDERSLLNYMSVFGQSLRPVSKEDRSPVYIGLSDETGFPHKGAIDFIDNRVDPGTGTMTVRGVFENPEHSLVPGMFARVLLKGSERYSAIQIPEESVGTDQSQKFVYIVDSENIVRYRRIELGPVIDGLRVVREGLDPDERVIINGIQRARPESKVDPVEGEIKISRDSATSYPVTDETGQEKHKDTDT